jgi:predicted anti-sigma-YlaC factor YlaD
MSSGLDCKEVSRIISDGLDKAMTPPERARLRLHLVVCETCRNVEVQMSFLRRAMQKLSQADKDRKPGE